MKSPTRCAISGVTRSPCGRWCRARVLTRPWNVPRRVTREDRALHLPACPWGHAHHERGEIAIRVWPWFRPGI